MSWSYRVLKTVIDDEVQYGICEYYLDEERGEGWTPPLSKLYENDIVSLRTTLLRMVEALDESIIEECPVCQGYTYFDSPENTCVNCAGEGKL